MDKELISKKEILEVTGISYGQLYRWKRKNLIPEDWFIKKSSFTGQETFFPRDKILQRIDKIIGMKENLSLDDMADMFSPMLKDILLNKQELVEKGIVSRMTCEIYESIYEATETFTFDKIMYITVLEKFLNSGGVSVEEGKIILQNLEENYKNFKDKGCQIVFLRKIGISISFLVGTPNEIYFDKSIKYVEKLNIPDLIEELKIKIFK
jgi:predicted DNA-binding transcriptional regulator AlpA